MCKCDPWKNYLYVRKNSVRVSGSFSNDEDLTGVTSDLLTYNVPNNQKIPISKLTSH